MSENRGAWRKCSSCKKDIQFNTKYYECSVSTCTGQRTGYVFCSVPCWEVHLPGARHRDAGAVERRSPASAALAAELGPVAASVPQRRIVGGPLATPVGSSKASSMANEVLVVVSKMKQYIRDVSEMNTAEEVSQKLSDLIRLQCDRAIENARADGRKTLMSRDFKF